MHFSLRDLQYFVAVAEHRHFGRAARQLNVSQPTLSMQLKKMEESLGAKLIERLPGDAILTPLGADVLPMARETLRLASAIEAHCDNKENRGRVRLGVIPTISPYLLPKINRSLGKGIQGRKISVVEAQTADLIRSLKDGSVDVAILSTPLKEGGIEEIEIYTEPFYMAVSASHPLAGRRKVRAEELKNERILLLGEGHCMRNQALSLCKLPQASEDADLSTTSIETLRSMVAMGAGITLIPKLAIRSGENITYIPFSESSTSRAVGLAFRSSYGDIDFVTMLADIIRDAAEKEGMRVVKS
jgi:LysR family hydrogen peroxide-inducible transcriptional activator